MRALPTGLKLVWTCLQSGTNSLYSHIKLFLVSVADSHAQFFWDLHNDWKNVSLSLNMQWREKNFLFFSSRKGKRIEWMKTERNKHTTQLSAVCAVFVLYPLFFSSSYLSSSSSINCVRILGKSYHPLLIFFILVFFAYPPHAHVHVWGVV